MKYLMKFGNYYEDYKIHYDYLGYLLYKKSVTGYNFLTFNQWAEKYYYDGIIKDKIIEIKVIEHDHKVYDPCLEFDHSYISNGLISHNCNYAEKIIEPIQSRCQTFIVQPPSKKEAAIRVKYILDEEKVEYDIQDLAVIVNAHYPDIRKIINTCQEQTINGKLTLSKQDIIESNYFSKVIEFLKSDDKPFNIINNIRQLIADNQIKHFEPLFRHLYDNVDNFAKGRVSNVILIIAEHSSLDVSVVDKEINAVAMIIKIVAEIKSK
jgi:DNA polymerase III delta prime subunit